MCFGHILGGRKSVMTYWTSSSGVYFDPYIRMTLAHGAETVHTQLGLVFILDVQKILLRKSAKYIWGQTFETEEEKEYFFLSRLDVIFKFLVFNAVKQGFFLVKKEWLESFYILLLYY